MKKLFQLSISVFLLFVSLSALTRDLQVLTSSKDRRKLWTHEDVLEYITPSAEFLSKRRNKTSSGERTGSVRQQILRAVNAARCKVVENGEDVFSCTNLMVKADSVTVTMATNEQYRISVYDYRDVNTVLNAFALRAEELYDLWSVIQEDYRWQKNERSCMLYEKNLLDVLCFLDDAIVVMEKDNSLGCPGSGFDRLIVKIVLSSVSGLECHVGCNERTNSGLGRVGFDCHSKLPH